MADDALAEYVRLDPASNLWDRVFTLHPLVLVGTIEPDGALDLAPKHMVTPMGWGPYFGFVCTPRHATYRNVERDGSFTVTYLRPDQVVLSSLTASPRWPDDTKPVVDALDVFHAGDGRGGFVRGGYLYLECRRHTVVDGFGDNSLVVGQVTAAYADERGMRISDGDDQAAIERFPLLGYISPGRWSSVGTSFSFPFPTGFER